MKTNILAIVIYLAWAGGIVALVVSIIAAMRRTSKPRTVAGLMHRGRR